MQALLVQLAGEHSLGFVAAAAAICVATGWLLSVLLQQAERVSAKSRRWWLVGTVLVAGLGVWTTHFMAMLGYRSDIALTYNAAVTLASAVIGALAVGVPLAASAIVRQAWLRAALGGVTGLGISAMHMTGMAALEGCLQAQSTHSAVAASLLGAGCMAFARVVVGIRNSRAWTCLMVTAGVCTAHFVAVAGTRLTSLNAGPVSHEHVTLTIFTAAAAVLLFGGTILAIMAAGRFDAQEQAHTATLTTALQNMSNGILTVSGSARVELFNDRVCDMLRLSRDELVRDMPLGAFLAKVGRAAGWDDARVARVLANHHAWMEADAATVVEHVFDDGRVLSITCQPVGGGAVLTYDDVTQQRQAQQQIMDLAFRDPLTGLANRRALKQEMEAGFDPKQRFKLLLIDLDRFKFVNDTYGHSVGDQLLIQVADRIRSLAGADGFVARLGGDEMAVLVYGDNELSQAVAHDIIQQVSEPFTIGETTLVIGASIGLCCSDDAATMDELMQRTDLALYEAKRRGRGRLTCYQPGMLEAVTERNLLEADMRDAIAKGQFHLVYQPVQSLGSNCIIGYEALIRWQHPTRGLVSPAQFIPLAEETGQIVAIGRWVLEEACREAATWPAGKHVAVNVSPVQLRSPLLMAHVTGALDRSGLPAQRLEIELTETAMVEDGEQIAHVLAALRTLGIKVAMDDFGTGYSSLAHLRDMPLDRIKIDRSFVSAAESDPHCMAVLKAITQMGRDMNIPTLAEGVETESQLEVLLALGCEAVQGYLIGKPQMPPIDLKSAAPLRVSRQ